LLPNSTGPARQCRAQTIDQAVESRSNFFAVRQQELIRALVLLTRCGLRDTLQRGFQPIRRRFRVFGVAGHLPRLPQVPRELKAAGALNVKQYPAVVIHGLADARTVLAFGRPVTLLSAIGAALYAGCGWWRALVEQARTEHPDIAIEDILDCADAPGLALGALRIGQYRIVLDPAVPAWSSVAAIATSLGGEVLAARPPAIDIADRAAARRLHDWLQVRTTPGDSRDALG
jgi:hypothetical protein